MKTRPFTHAKTSSVMQNYRSSNHQESRYYCDLCKGEVGEAEGKELPDDRFVHKRHKIQVPVVVESPPNFWGTLKSRVNEFLYEGLL